MGKVVKFVKHRGKRIQRSVKGPSNTRKGRFDRLHKARAELNHLITSLHRKARMEFTRALKAVGRGRDAADVLGLDKEGTDVANRLTRLIQRLETRVRE